MYEVAKLLKDLDDLEAFGGINQLDRRISQNNC